MKKVRFHPKVRVQYYRLTEDEKRMKRNNRKEIEKKYSVYLWNVVGVTTS